MACGDPDVANALLMEMQEVLHRITVTQQLLLNETNAKLATAVEKVENANQDLSAALAEIQKAADVVNSVTKFLALVDKAIDLAKTLGAAI